MFMDDDDDKPQQPRYTINYDRLIADIYNYNNDEDRFVLLVNEMCLDIEAIDEYVKLMPNFDDAQAVIKSIKGKL